MKKLVISVIAILVCVASFFIYSSYLENKAESVKLEELSNSAVELNAKKSLLKKQIEEIKDERDEELRFGNYMILFFDNMEENLYTDVYPLLSSYGHKGTVVMKDLVIPGDEGAISREHFDLLMTEGWDAAIGCSDSVTMTDFDATEQMTAYLDKYIAKLKANNITVPVTFCFDKGDYSEEFEEVLSHFGFKIIRHYGETGDTYASSVADDFFYIGSGWYCAAATTLESAVVSAYEKELTYSVSTGKILNEVTDTKKDCTLTKYKRMLDYIEAKCNGMEICTVTELYNIKMEQFTQVSGSLAKYNEQIEEKEKEVSEIEEQIEAIYNSLS